MRDGLSGLKGEIIVTMLAIITLLTSHLPGLGNAAYFVAFCTFYHWG
jgi:hypothetical protein